ncbi:DUF4177 domain-containing protein [Polaribacter glomeratus]|uniref:DUF4177 domain-containing protein n=1 Tax=Polaribacter glomeratus TaxID=102 RepID=A0A2S7WX45_9FLAO|nr:DUF4177 domain-containing protein [Polaribacter glomeratus]PQJ82056.1 hypothetical protein BTO16_05470 [Polaribacter glomeratus]TXD66648.1 DUF4177 domain-containing protein [Polaribacter glomeratus]
MKEYKFLKQKMSWSNSQNNFEEEINSHAKQGWRVISVYANSNGGVYAVLEKDKNR